MQKKAGGRGAGQKGGQLDLVAGKVHNPRPSGSVWTLFATGKSYIMLAYMCLTRKKRLKTFASVTRYF